ncbi:transposase [Streptomyces sp. NPDC057950]|uniref:transposase n=1 Tax=Streptomyces sp. NPDC057950 TaxID=3346288 RepID=UPI0036F0122F
MGRGDLTDEQWAVLEPLLPTGTKAGRPPVWLRRQLIDGIRFRVRTGVPWRDVPVEYGRGAGSTTCSADGSPSRIR